MSIKVFKPTTPGQRGMTTRDFSEITSKKPGARSLLKIKKITSGRNNQGRITTRHRGGGAKRFYRLVNHKLASGISATIEQIEYDPNRSANIALLREKGGKPHYILAADGMKPGQVVSSGADAAIENGNRLPIHAIPLGSSIYGIELQPGRGAQMVRSAGARAQLMAREGELAQIKLPSGEVRKVSINCMASIGSVGNAQHQNVKIGKAGRKRHMGIRPSVRGKAMNPVDHPMGGGEGQTGPGRNPKTPWGKIAIGLKTRRRKYTQKMIVKTRAESKRR